MTNTEATSIDLDLIEYAAEMARANPATHPPMILLDTRTSDALVAAVKAAMRVVGNPSRTPYTPPTSALVNKEHAGPMNDLAEAIQPFTVRK